MTTDQKRGLKEFAVAVLIILLLLWFLHHVAPSSQSSSDSAPPQVGLVPPALNTVSLASPPTGDDCNCGTATNSCPISPYTVSTVAKMVSLGQQYSDAIDAAGNATLQAIADIANKNNPLLQVTVG